MTKKIYTNSDERKLTFICYKKGKYLVATDTKDKSVTYGKINITNGQCIGGTHCFDGLREALKEYRKAKS